MAGMTEKQREIVTALYREIQEECSRGILAANHGATLAQTRKRVDLVAEVVGRFQEALALSEAASGVLDSVEEKRAARREADADEDRRYDELARER